MTPKQEALALAQALDVTIIEGCSEICLEAPRHKVFKGCGLHGTVHDYSCATEGKRAGWKAALAELREGLDDCPEPAGFCEVCDE